MHFRDAPLRIHLLLRRLQRFLFLRRRQDGGGGETKSDDNYQSTQAQRGIVNGGIINFQPGGGSIKNDLFSAQSDFVYSTIVEEFGAILGGLGLVLLYLILFYRCLKITAQATNKFGAYVAFGLSFTLVLQAMVNMGVGSTLLPVTGQPLPLVSMGGTSIVFSCIAIGIVLSISRNSLEGEYEKA